VPRALLVGSLAATLLAWNWLRLEQGGAAGEAALVVALALAPSLVAGRRARAAAAAIALLLAGAVAFDLRLDWNLPGGVLSAFGDGFVEFYDVQVPFDAGAHPRMHGVLLIAVFAFALAVALAAAASRPGLAAMALVVGVGWPATLLPGHDLLRGALLLAVVLVTVSVLRRSSLRGVGTAVAAGTVVVLAAVAASSSPALAKRAFLDWQRWDPYTKPAKPVDVSFVWDSSYTGLTFRGKPTTVLRIEADSTPEYWRATVLNTVKQGTWLEDQALESVEPEVLAEDDLVPDRAIQRRRGAGVNRVVANRWVRQDVTVEALRDRHLVGRSVPLSFEPGSGLSRVGYDPTGIAEAEQPLRRGDSYEVWSYSPSPTPGQLARSKPTYPASIARESRYREVEPRIYPRLFGAPDRDAFLQYLFSERYARSWQIRPYRQLYLSARAVAGDAKSPYAAAVALERWFRVAGGFTYDQHPPLQAGVPPLVDFVARTRRGYCQHFAGAMALMLRYLGIPARVAVGFKSGRYNRDKDEWRVSDRDAHTWVEVWFRGWGWLPFDPTPSRGGLSGSYSTSSPNFDLAATAAVLAGAGGIRPSLADRLGFSGPPRVSPDVPDLSAAPPQLTSPQRSRAWGLMRLLALAVGGLVLLVVTTKLLVRLTRFLTRDPRRLAAACRRDLQAFLLDQGVDVPQSATLRELARLVEAEFGVTAGGFGLHATAARFAPSPGAGEAARAMRRDLRALRRDLRRELTRLERARGLVSLRSLGLTG
jgi:protein-glutamine gamma-glutamyltransferase